MNPIQLIKMIQGAQNPIQVMQNMMSMNPQFQRAMQMAQGKSPAELQQVCRNMCGQIGVNFDDMTAQMRQMGLNVPITTSPAENAK